MEKPLNRVGMVSGILYLIMSGVYSDSPIADFGITEISSNYLVYGLPALAGAITALFNFNLKLPTLPSFKTKDGGSDYESLLHDLNSIELRLTKIGGPVMDCQRLRNFVLEKLK